MPTGSVTNYYPPKPGNSGKLMPAMFKLENDPNTYKAFAPVPDGMGEGAKVQFPSARPDEYNGKVSYIVKDLEVLNTPPGTTAAAPSGNRDERIEYQAAMHDAARYLAAARDPDVLQDAMAYADTLHEYTRAIVAGYPWHAKAGQKEELVRHLEAAGLEVLGEEDLNDDIPF